MPGKKNFWWSWIWIADVWSNSGAICCWAWVGWIVIVSIFQVGSGVTRIELVLISVAVTTWVPSSRMVVTTWKKRSLTFRKSFSQTWIHLIYWHLIRKSKSVLCWCAICHNMSVDVGKNLEFAKICLVHMIVGKDSQSSWLVQILTTEKWTQIRIFHTDWQVDINHHHLLLPHEIVMLYLFVSLSIRVENSDLSSFHSCQNLVLMIEVQLWVRNS